MSAAPEAMALATASPDAAPSVRMVLLKSADEHGLVFYSHHTSRKGRELEANPQAALLFHWSPLGREVRVEGRVSALPGRVGWVFRMCPRDAQLGALASRQSESLGSRDELEERRAGVGERDWWTAGAEAGDMGGTSRRGGSESGSTAASRTRRSRG